MRNGQQREDGVHLAQRELAAVRLHPLGRPCRSGGDYRGRHRWYLLPYTLRPTPYTLHPTPYTLRLTPYTLHPTPYNLQPTSYTPHPKPHTLNLEPLRCT